jgi:hypothetical protein
MAEFWAKTAGEYTPREKQAYEAGLALAKKRKALSVLAVLPKTEATSHAYFYVALDEAMDEFTVGPIRRP